MAWILSRLLSYNYHWCETHYHIQLWHGTQVVCLLLDIDIPISWTGHFLEHSTSQISCRYVYIPFYHSVLEVEEARQYHAPQQLSFPCEHECSAKSTGYQLLRGWPSKRRIRDVDQMAWKWSRTPGTTSTGCYVGLRSIRWFESSRARSALFPSSAMKLVEQSDGGGTGELLSILRRTGRWRCLHLVIDSLWYLSKTITYLWYFAPIILLNTVLTCLMSGGFPSAITSAWPSMSRQQAAGFIVYIGCSGLHLLRQYVY